LKNEGIKYNRFMEIGRQIEMKCFVGKKMSLFLKPNESGDIWN